MPASIAAARPTKDARISARHFFVMGALFSDSETPPPESSDREDSGERLPQRRMTTCSGRFECRSPRVQPNSVTSTTIAAGVQRVKKISINARELHKFRLITCKAVMEN